MFGFLLFFAVFGCTFGLRVLGVVLLFFFLGWLFCSLSSWVLGAVLLFFSLGGLFCLLLRPGCWASCCSFFSLRVLFAYFFALGAGRRAAFFFLSGLFWVPFSSLVLGVVLLFFSLRWLCRLLFHPGGWAPCCSFFFHGLFWRERATVGIVVGKHETLAFFSENKTVRPEVKTPTRRTTPLCLYICGSLLHRQVRDRDLFQIVVGGLETLACFFLKKKKGTS